MDNDPIKDSMVKAEEKICKQASMLMADVEQKAWLPQCPKGHSLARKLWTSKSGASPMNKLMKFPMILATLSITSAGLAAERYDREAGAYAGGGIGYYRINDADFFDENDRLKDNRGALRAYAGLEAARIFAIEAAYTDFGSTSDGNADMELTGLSGALLINIPVLDMVAPYVKAGVIAWDRERDFGPLSDNDDGSDAFYGLGVRFALMPSLDMRIEYERYAIDDTDIDMGSLNLQYRF